jgi:hypothetical protein
MSLPPNNVLGHALFSVLFWGLLEFLFQGNGNVFGDETADVSTQLTSLFE